MNRTFTFLVSLIFALFFFGQKQLFKWMNKEEIKKRANKEN